MTRGGTGGHGNSSLAERGLADSKHRSPGGGEVKFPAGVGIWSAALGLRWGRVQPDLRERADPGALEAVLPSSSLPSPPQRGLADSGVGHGEGRCRVAGPVARSRMEGASGGVCGGGHLGGSPKALRAVEGWAHGNDRCHLWDSGRGEWDVTACMVGTGQGLPKHPGSRRRAVPGRGCREVSWGGRGAF